MVQILLLTRGGLADEWLRATAGVRGCPADGIAALGLDWDGDSESERAHVHTLVSAIKEAGPVLVLTDLHGSTQSNLAAELAADPQIAVVAGANLAMVLRLACDPRRDRSLDELAEWIRGKGQAAIQVVRAKGAAEPESGPEEGSAP